MHPAMMQSDSLMGLALLLHLFKHGGGEEKSQTKKCKSWKNRAAVKPPLFVLERTNDLIHNVAASILGD